MVATPLSADDRAYMLAVVRRIVRCEDAANDATQDALLLAHRHRDKFRGASAFRTWLYRIAVTTALGYLRKRRRSREDIAAEPTLLDAVDPTPSPETIAATRQLADHARDILDAIHGDHRAVFLMTVDDVPGRDIAATLGISVANVKIRAYRARQRLRDSFATLAVDENLALSA
jgi:RNA polymerase sigma-70 factor, ECF subfamily